MSSLFKNVKGKMEKAKLFTLGGGGGVSDVLEEISKKHLVDDQIDPKLNHSKQLHR